MDKVSVIIPTYNRFKYLLDTLQSIREQTYPNIEIIVVNDCSTEPEYHTHDWNSMQVQMIHLEVNTKQKFGYGCPAYVRNVGIDRAQGKYIAFCDDDDRWFPTKIELQLDAMKKMGCKMSSTDGCIGNGLYCKEKTYPKYNAEYYYPVLQQIYKGSRLLEKGFPRRWNLDFLRVHNFMITSSVVLEKEILTKIENMKLMAYAEDYDCWLRALEHTDSVYLPDVCFYYDNGHGYGQMHGY